MGHTEIGCVTGPLGRRSATERLQGLRTAMAEAGLPVREEWIVEGDYDCGGGIRALQRLMTQPARPALFVCNDMMALGVLSEAARMGLRVPEDLSLVGYDDIYIARYMTPALTTIHQSTSEIAAMAVDTLIERLESKRDKGRVIRIEPRLVERDSVRKVK